VGTVAIACLYGLWVSVPIVEPRTLGYAYVQGAIGAAVCGVGLAFVVRHVLDLLLASSFGILLGHAWALQRTTDVFVPFWNSVVASVPELRRYHVLLIAVIVTSWGIMTMLARRYGGPERRGISHGTSAVEQ
jgi:hypothetical protein